MGTPGFVYVLSNPSMPGIVKIGRSARHPELRAQELYKTSSGVPEPFVLEFAIYCKEDHEGAEEWVHENVHMSRVNGSREFFRLEVNKAIEEVAHVALFDRSISVCETDLFIEQPTVLTLSSWGGINPAMLDSALHYMTEEEMGILVERMTASRKRIMEARLS